MTFADDLKAAFTPRKEPEACPPDTTLHSRQYIGSGATEVYIVKVPYPAAGSATIDFHVVFERPRDCLYLPANINPDVIASFSFAPQATDLNNAVVNPPALFDLLPGTMRRFTTPFNEFWVSVAGVGAGGFITLLAVLGLEFLSNTNDVNATIVGQPVETLEQDCTFPTYSEASSAVAPSTTGDVFQVVGNGTKVIRIRYVSISANKTALGFVDFLFLKRSTAGSGGVSIALTPCPHDSNNPATTATVTGFTTPNPVAGALIGVLRTFLYDVGSGDVVLFDSAQPQCQPIVLRGTEIFCVNVASGTLTGLALSVNIMWSEEDN